jgi:hypothetical protein
MADNKFFPKLSKNDLNRNSLDRIPSNPAYSGRTTPGVYSGFVNNTSNSNPSSGYTPTSNNNASPSSGLQENLNNLSRNNPPHINPPARSGCSKCGGRATFGG